MRLQVEILRHTLPPVNIVFNTSSSQIPIKTVADLLLSLDRIIPLESADSEWGLEDYIVEVAATYNQHNRYECLHYQLVKDVFREDNEVVVRGLTSDELRERRQGGRLQILSDGRHLFDGVAWGRRLRAHAHRPGIIIPPRKRRRLLPAEEQDSEQDQTLLQLEFPHSGAQSGTFVSDEEDDEADSEYKDTDDDDDDEEEQEQDDNDDYECEVSNDDAAGAQPRQIITREDFDDADISSKSSDEGTDDEVRENGLEEDEVQLLLREAGELEEAYHSLPLEMRITSPPKKRKRTEEDEVPSDGRDVIFEGFSSPVKDRKQNLPRPSQINGSSQDMLGRYLITDPIEDVTGLSGGIEGVGMEGSKPAHEQQFGKLKANGVDHMQVGSDDSDEGSDSESDSESTSSSGDSDTDSDSQSEASDESTDDHSDTSSDTSASESGSSSDSDETSSSSDDSDSQSDSESQTVAVAALKQKESAMAPGLKQSLGDAAARLQVDNPPGSGSKRTRANNQRAKQRKRLDHLKEQGYLPASADFDALRAYEAGTSTAHSFKATEKDSSPVSSELALKKAEMLARLSAVYDVHNVLETQVEDMPAEVEIDDQPQPDSAQVVEPVLVSEDLSAAEDPSMNEQTETISPQKRARLDVDSSRRMLFSSLGLRTPKTPAAEKELREKLSKPARNIQSKLDEAKKPELSVKNDDESWKEKLVISAVECVQEGLVLSPPPFPFKQRWERDIPKNRTRAPEQTYYRQNNRDVAPATDVETSVLDDSHVETNVSKSPNEPSNVSTGILSLDDIPVLEDLTKYPVLTQEDIRVDAIIAYKELQLGPKFEPEESSYRTAQITAINKDSIEVIISQKDRRAPATSDVDADDNQGAFAKFDMPMDEYDFEDDGLRETAFDRMINPKLIQASSIQVPSSEIKGASKASGSEAHPNTTIVPDSVPAQDSTDSTDIPHVEVDTPRRTEINNIIDGAGFTSAVDEKLLQPIDISNIHRTAMLSDPGSRASSKAPSESRKEATSLRKEASNEWRSSSFEPDIENNTSQLVDQNQISVQVNISSPPSVSMVETVDYPHVSQIDINQSSLADRAGSSSHQDAQRVSPDVSDIEHSDFTHLRVKHKLQTPNEESQSSSLPSEVPQSQPIGFDGQIDESVSLRGGHTGTGFDFELGSDIDSDDLPSLHALTSSQQNRLSRNTNSRTSSSHVRSGVSPPALRKNRNALTHPESPVSDDETHEPEIKISASQKSSLTMSQIPQPASVVDLTFSSDPIEPDEKENENSDDEHESPRARRRAARTVKAGPSTKKSQSSSRAAKSAFVGLGTKRNLKGKGRSQA